MSENNKGENNETKRYKAPEGKHTVILTSEEYENYIKNNGLSTPLKVTFASHDMLKSIKDDVYNLVKGQGELCAKIEVSETERKIIQSNHDNCKARIAFVTGERIIAGSKKIYVAFGIICSIIGAGIVALLGIFK